MLLDNNFSVVIEDIVSKIFFHIGNIVVVNVLIKKFPAQSTPNRKEIE